MTKQSNSASPYGLTRKQLAFCDYFRADPTMNQTAAYSRSHPGCNSENAAAASATRLLKKNKAKQYLHACSLRVAKKVDIEQESVLQEIARIALFDLMDLFDDQGKMLPVDQWPEGAGSAIQTVSIGDDGKIQAIKMWDKGRQLDSLVKILGMADRDNSERDAVDLLSQMYQRIRPTTGLPSQQGSMIDE